MMIDGDFDGRIRLLIAATVPATIRGFLLPYADHYRGLGWRVDAAARGVSSVPDVVERFDAVHDVQWSRSPLAPGNISAMRRFAELVAENRYDIVHVHTPVAAFAARAALRNMRPDPKVVYTAHGFHFYEGAPLVRGFIYRTLERIAARWTDRLIVINREDRLAVKRYGMMPDDRVERMPGIGLDFAKYRRADVSREAILAVRTEMGLKDDDVLFTMLAEYNRGKRHRDVLTALSMLKDRPIHVAFAGDGVLFSKMKDLAKSLGVAERAHFLGYVKEPNALMAASRATIIASEREGLSRSAMESVCLNVPVIGTDARGVRDVIGTRRGRIYPVGDASALRDVMAFASEEPPMQVKPDPDWRIEHLFELHDALYSGLLKEKMAESGDQAPQRSE